MQPKYRYRYVNKLSKIFEFVHERYNLKRGHLTRGTFHSLYKFQKLNYITKLKEILTEFIFFMYTILMANNQNTMMKYVDDYSIRTQNT